MNSIVNDLNRALAQHLLVNVYQTDQEVVYTGYVTAVSDAGLILATFDDYGLPDGAVFLAVPIIDEVEFSSDDLDNMAFRIQTAADEDFVQAGGLTLRFDNQRNLRQQVLSHAWVDHLVIMLVLKDDEHFYEGRVAAVASDQVTIKLFNKFDFTDQSDLVIDPANIDVIEFQGQELSLQGLATPHLTQLKHVASTLIDDHDEMIETLKRLEGQAPLVALIPKNDEDLFFVGRVNVVTADAVVLNLVDMTGQFGGYSLMRLSELHAVVLSSDYLQTMRVFTMLNQARQQQLQPVLNDERLFDRTVDQFQARLTQAAAFRTIIRIRLHDGSTMLGYPDRVGGGKFIFHQVVESQLDQVGQIYQLSAVDEVAFGYLDAYLVEHQLRVEGDL
ncbi:hypothetical protein ACFQET_02710 [Levilactobacillus tangyuanensis]|uniref:DUF4868 domain-containing protein n=1 Tax=Levilactobacillus tangyuanensis TaxID=2486021 RepID=A0ABW1TLS3_9LACO|nr:hypothetical protein [Levilactobacillus tangyuanensis]